MKYSNQILIIYPQLYGFKYSYLIPIIIWFQVIISIQQKLFVCTYLYGFKLRIKILS